VPLPVTGGAEIVLKNAVPGGEKFIRLAFFPRKMEGRLDMNTKSRELVMSVVASAGLVSGEEQMAAFWK